MESNTTWLKTTHQALQQGRPALSSSGDNPNIGMVRKPTATLSARRRNSTSSSLSTSSSRHSRTLANIREELDLAPLQHDRVAALGQDSCPVLLAAAPPTRQPHSMPALVQDEGRRQLIEALEFAEQAVMLDRAGQAMPACAQYRSAAFMLRFLQSKGFPYLPQAQLVSLADTYQARAKVLSSLQSGQVNGHSAVKHRATHHTLQLPGGRGDTVLRASRMTVSAASERAALQDPPRARRTCIGGEKARKSSSQDKFFRILPLSARDETQSGRAALLGEPMGRSLPAPESARTALTLSAGACLQRDQDGTEKSRSPKGRPTVTVNRGARPFARPWFCPPPAPLVVQDTFPPLPPAFKRGGDLQAHASDHMLSVSTDCVVSMIAKGEHEQDVISSSPSRQMDKRTFFSRMLTKTKKSLSDEDIERPAKGGEGIAAGIGGKRREKHPDKTKKGGSATGEEKWVRSTSRSICTRIHHATTSINLPTSVLSPPPRNSAKAPQTNSEGADIYQQLPCVFDVPGGIATIAVSATTPRCNQIAPHSPRLLPLDKLAVPSAPTAWHNAPAGMRSTRAETEIPRHERDFISLEEKCAWLVEDKPRRQLSRNALFLGKSRMERGVSPTRDASLFNIPVPPFDEPMPTHGPSLAARQTIWIMQQVGKSTSTGAYLSPNLYIPSALWTQVDIRLPNLVTKNLACSIACELLMKLASLHPALPTTLPDIFLKEMEGVCKDLHRLHEMLASSIGFIQRPATKEDTARKPTNRVKRSITKLSSPVPGFKVEERPLVVYSGTWKKLCENVQFIGLWLEHFRSPQCEWDSTLVTRSIGLLNNIVSFFRNAVLPFLLVDLQSLIIHFLQAQKTHQVYTCL